MKVNNDEPHPWMLEDVQLRCDLAAGRFQAALELGKAVLPRLEGSLAERFARNLADLDGLLRRSRAYVYHIRASSLAGMLRVRLANDEELPDAMRAELLAVLRADQTNMGQPEPLGTAIALYERNLPAFLRTYFTVTENVASKGVFSLTSR